MSFSFRLACTLLLLSSFVTNLSAQGYTLRPGPRGFDARMNRYGATETKKQSRAGDRNQDNISSTTLRIEILMPPSGAVLAAQQWSRRLAEMGYSARTRSPLLDDQPDIQESTRGPLRYVTLIGALDTRGHLRFPGHSFSLSEAGKLQEWLEELETYGAQGSPDGQPLWGLDREQFDRLHQALQGVIESDTSGQPLKSAITELPLPPEFPVTFSVEAAQQLQSGTTNTIESVAGLSVGTGLAYLLSEQDLGFRPARTPEGAIELRVEPLPATVRAAGQDEKTPSVWPVGWSLREEPSPREEQRDEEGASGELPLRLQLAPSYFKVARIGLQNISLRKALAVSTDRTGVPVLVALPALKRAGVDLDTTMVNLPTQHQSWSLAMKRLTAAAHLRSYLRRDEVGNPFVWITTAPGARHWDEN